MLIFATMVEQALQKLNITALNEMQKASIEAAKSKNDIVLIIGNFIAVALNTFMLFLKIKYSKNPLDEES